jgi:hypothetical protein
MMGHQWRGGRPDAHCGALIGSFIATQLSGKKRDLFHDVGILTFVGRLKQNEIPLFL